MAKKAMSKTPFSLTFQIEAMIPAEVKVLSFRYDNYDEQVNEVQLVAEKDMIKEQYEQAWIRIKDRRNG